MTQTGSGGRRRQQCSTGFIAALFDYDTIETHKVVTIRNAPLGSLRRLFQAAVIAFVVLYQLWYARGYQKFWPAESAVTTKVKGTFV